MKQSLNHSILFCLILMVAAGCHNHTSSNEEAHAEIKLDTAAFRSLFKELTFDSLYLVSDGDSFQNPKCYLYGTPFDTIYAWIFPDTILHYAIGIYPGPDMQFAVGRFDLDAGYEAYLIRHHGEDAPSVITLLIYDKKNRRFLDENLEVAQNWGDAGDDIVINSTLKNKGNTMEIAMNESGSSHELSDTTFNTLLQEQSTSLYKVEHGHISLINETVLKRDTIYMVTPPDADTTSD